MTKELDRWRANRTDRVFLGTVGKLWGRNELETLLLAMPELDTERDEMSSRQQVADAIEAREIALLVVGDLEHLADRRVVAPMRQAALGGAQASREPPPALCLLVGRGVSKDLTLYKT